MDRRIWCVPWACEWADEMNNARGLEMEMDDWPVGRFGTACVGNHRYPVV